MKKESAEKLHEAITDLLWGPGGDVCQDTLLPCANIVQILKDEGFMDIVSKDVLDMLRGSNIENENYLEDLGFEKWVETDEDEEVGT